MNKRIFIIEDDIFDWRRIKHMLNQKGLKYFPKFDEDFEFVLRSFNLITHPNEYIKAKIDLLNFINENDFVLLDFLIKEDRFFDGIKLYRELGLSNKAIVYTKFKGIEGDHEKIVKSLRSNSVLSEDLIFKKPGNFARVFKNEHYIDELYNAILFGNDYKKSNPSSPYDSKQ